MTAESILKNKARIWEYHLKLTAAAANSNTVSDLLRGYLDEDIVLHAMHPINEQKGVAAVDKNFWQPLVTSFPDLERNNDIFMGGAYKGEEWVSATGHYVATFYKDWLGIPATGELVTIRFGEFSRLVDGKIKEQYIILDVLDVMRQAKVWPLAFSLGKEDWWPKPSNNKGIILNTQDAVETNKTLKLHAKWISELKNFPDDVNDFKLLRHAEYLHPRYMQHASSGFGASRGVHGLQKYFQEPFFSAFSKRKFGNYQTRFAEGGTVAASGWENVKAQQTGKFLAYDVTGKTVKIRMMEWWRRAGERMKENWLLIDTPDLLRQMDVNVFAEMNNLQAKDRWL